MWTQLGGECAAALPDVLHQLAFERSTLGPLLERYPEQIAQAATWALIHRDKLTSVFGHRIHPVEPFLFDLLVGCGNTDTIHAIEPYVDDPELGTWAVEAVRAQGHCKVRDRGF